MPCFYFKCLKIKRLAGWISLTLTAGLLSGCFYITNSRALSEPTETDERARIRVISNALVRGFPNARCVSFPGSKAGVIYDKWSNSGSQGFRNREIGMPPSKFYEVTPKDLFGKNVLGFEKAEFYITANQPITLNLFGFSRPGGRFSQVYHCDFSLAFTPETGKDYEAVFYWDKEVCLGDIVSLTEPDKQVSFEKVGNCE